MKIQSLLPQHLIKRTPDTPKNEHRRQQDLVTSTLRLAKQEQELGLDFNLKGKGSNRLEPETVAKISKWQAAMNEETAKKLFIRNQALTAYRAGTVQETSEGIIREIFDSLSVSAMNKSEIALHIGQLEKARALLAALTQGYEIAYAEEKEPEFRKNHAEREAKERKEKKVGDTLSKLGVSKETLLAALADIRASKGNSNPAPVIGNNPTPVPEATTLTTPIEKATCPKCSKEFAVKMKAFHRC